MRLRLKFALAAAAAIAVGPASAGVGGSASAAEGGVTAVVVYPDRAQVVRARDAACSGGRASVTFEGIPPAADPATLRAQATSGTVDGLRWQERTRAEAFGAEAKDVETRIRKIEIELREIRDGRSRAESVAALASNLGAVAVAHIDREMAQPAPGVKEWSTALEMALSHRLKASAETATTDGKLREMEARLADLRARQAETAAASRRREFVAEALVSCADGKRPRVEISYVVGGAGWSPAYEARLGAQAGMVEIATWATVRQSTGEDWRDARIVLSTAVPRQNATPPEIAALRVWADKRPPPRKVLVSRSELQQHAQAPSGASAGPGQPRVAVAEQGLSVQMALPEPADVPGDGTPARLLVARTPMRADVAYRSAPKVLPFVFRVADLTNMAPFPLLPGPVDAFRKGNFLGRSQLDRVPVGARFTLTFGVEETIKLHRAVIEEVQRDKGVLGTTRSHRYAYRVEVANYLPRAEHVEIVEQVPVSELDDVKVVVDGKTTGGYAHDREDGLLTWKLKLAPGEKRILDLAFRIEAPSSYEQ